MVTTVLPKTRTTGLLRRFLADETGATAVEYAALMMMVAIAMFGLSTLTNVANRENGTFNSITNALQ